MVREPVKECVILVPGIVCDRAVWEAQSTALAAVAEVRVAEHDHSDCLGTLAENLLRQAPARFALAGHSMGGRIALEVIRRAPERVSRLALMDTGFEPRAKGAAGETEAAGRRRLLEIARAQGMRAMGQEWLQKMVHPQRLRDPGIVIPILDMIERNPVEKFAAQIQAMMQREDAKPLLSGIRCPTLLLCGREDTWSPLQRHENMAKLIPDNRLAVIEHCGHMSTLERPEEVNRALLDWLA